MKEKLDSDWVEYMYHWRYSQSSALSSLVFELIAKSDMRNLERVRKGFPEAVRVWEVWRSYPTEKEFFDDYLDPKPS